MTKILNVNSSLRTGDSVSRQATAEFISKWLAKEPNAVVVERDVAAQPLPHLTGETLGAFFTPAENRTPEQVQINKLSETLVAELFDADVIVIGAPMYNFSITSGLKAWIDHVARAGVTFKYTEQGPVGQLTGKKVYIFTASGGVYSEGPAQAMDYTSTYLRAVLGFIGLTDVTFIQSEGIALGAESVQKAQTKTSEAINELLAA